MDDKDFEVMDVELPVEIGVKDSENWDSESDTQQVLDNVLCDD